MSSHRVSCGLEEHGVDKYLVAHLGRQSRYVHQGHVQRSTRHVPRQAVKRHWYGVRSGY